METRKLIIGISILLILSTFLSAIINEQKEIISIYKNGAFIYNEKSNILPYSAVESSIFSPTTKALKIKKMRELERNIGKHVVFFNDKNSIEGELIKVKDNKAYIKKDEKYYVLKLSDYNYVVDNIGDATIVESEGRLSYALQSLTWQGNVIINLEGDKAHLFIRAKIDNQEDRVFKGEVFLYEGDASFPFSYSWGVKEAMSALYNYHFRTPENVEGLKEYHIGEKEIPAKATLIIELGEGLADYEEKAIYYTASQDKSQSSLYNAISLIAPVELPSGEFYLYKNNKFIGYQGKEGVNKGEKIEFIVGEYTYLKGKTEVKKVETIANYLYKTMEVTITNYGNKSVDVEVVISPPLYGEVVECEGCEITRKARKSFSLQPGESITFEYKTRMPLLK